MKTNWKSFRRLIGTAEKTWLNNEIFMVGHQKCQLCPSIKTVEPNID